jgi:hypothetical protein
VLAGCGCLSFDGSMAGRELRACDVVVRALAMRAGTSTTLKKREATGHGGKAGHGGSERAKPAAAACMTLASSASLWRAAGPLSVTLQL